MLTRRTPEAHAAVLEAFRRFRSDGQFVPLQRRRRDRRLPRLRRRRRVGRTGLRSGDGPALRERERDGVDGHARAGGHRIERPAALREECASCHRDDMSGAPPQIPSLVGRRPPQAAGRADADRPPGPRADAGLAGVVVRGGRRARRLRRHRRESRTSPTPARPAAAQQYRFTGYRTLPRSGWLSRDRAAVGHAHRHRPEHRRARLADPARRVPGAGRAGLEEHRQRELRRSDRDRRRPGVHRRHQLSTRRCAPSTRRRARSCGRRRCPSRQSGTPATYEVDGRQFLVVPAGGGKARRPEPSVASTSRSPCRRASEPILSTLVDFRSGRILDVRLDARRAACRPPPGPHAGVHAGDVAHAGVGDWRQHGDLQRRQHRPPQAAAVRRAGSTGGPLADRARSQHHRPQRVDRRLRHVSGRVPDAGGCRHLEPHRAHGDRAWPSRSGWMASTPPSGCCRCWASSRSSAGAFAERDNEERQPRGRDARPWLLAAAVRWRSGRRRAADQGRWHRARDRRCAAAGLLVHGRAARSRAAAPLRSRQGAPRRLQLPGDRPAAPRRQHRGGGRGRRADDRGSSWASFRRPTA